MAKRINCVYFDNYNCDINDWRDYYQEYNDLDDEDMADVNDESLYSFMYQQIDNDFDDFWGNMKHSHYNNVPCVIVGSVGVWTGRHTIVPTTCKDLESALSKCIDNMDYFSIKQVNGHLEVKCSHHDGTNTFDIYLLNERGISAMECINEGFGRADLSNKCYHKAIDYWLF